jgi:hypothetical protein
VLAFQTLWTRKGSKVRHSQGVTGICIPEGNAGIEQNWRRGCEKLDLCNVFWAAAHLQVFIIRRNGQNLLIVCDELSLDSARFWQVKYLSSILEVHAFSVLFD